MRPGAENCPARSLVSRAVVSGAAAAAVQAAQPRDQARRPDAVVPLPAPPARRAARGRQAGPALRPRVRAALAAGAGLALLWAGLTGGGAEAWVFGVPAVLAGVAVAWALAPAAHWRLSPAAALRFGAWFAIQAIRGAVDVALRACDPRLPVAPGRLDYPLGLPDGAPRLVMANAITLLPGTLTAELHDDHMIVHVLDQRADVTADLRALELRVRALFALAPPGPVPLPVTGPPPAPMPEGRS